MNKVVIVSAVRTPLGSFMGALSTIPATQLGATAIAGALSKINLDPKRVEEVFMGLVIQAGTGQAPARQAALGAGISESVPCTTINKVCASGMKSIMFAAQSIALGDRSIVVAGGMENMSLAPHLAPLRTVTKFGNISFKDSIQLDGLEDAYSHEAMGIYADQCAAKYHISREQQDTYAIESYKKAAKAHQSGEFESEIIPVEIPQRKGDSVFVTQDEEFQRVDFDKVAQLRPAFTKEGTVTAANASTINDGASALVLMSEQKAQELQLKPLAYLRSYADASLAPELFTEAPAKALPEALKKAKVSLEEIDLFEINEAFSVVSIVNGILLNINPDKLNVKGGAVALGHPLGCSGARITTTLIHTLKQQNARLGAAAICNGGGGASALIIENIF